MRLVISPECRPHELLLMAKAIDFYADEVRHDFSSWKRLKQISKNFEKAYRAVNNNKEEK